MSGVRARGYLGLAWEGAPEEEEEEGAEPGGGEGPGLGPVRVTCARSLGARACPSRRGSWRLSVLAELELIVSAAPRGYGLHRLAAVAEGGKLDSLQTSLPPGMPLWLCVVTLSRLCTVFSLSSFEVQSFAASLVTAPKANFFRTEPEVRRTSFGRACPSRRGSWRLSFPSLRAFTKRAFVVHRRGCASRLRPPRLWSSGVGWGKLPINRPSGRYVM